MHPNNNVKILNNIIKNKNTVIFDLDGTLCNSEPLHWQAHNRVLSPYNIVLGQKEIERYLTLTYNEYIESICNDFNLDKLTISKDYNAKRIGAYLSLISDLKLFDWVKPLLESCKDKHVVLLSTNQPVTIYAVLYSLGIIQYFDEIIPAPNGKLRYLHNYDPKSTIIFEDSIRTIEYAKGLGIDTVAVRHQYNQNVEFPKNTYVINEASNYDGRLTIEHLNGKYIFWDIDGVLAPYRYNGHTCSPKCKPDDPYHGLTNEEIEEGWYLKREPLHSMQKLIKEINPKRNIIMGHYKTEKERSDKELWLNKYYPEIKERLLTIETRPKHEAVHRYCWENKVPLNKAILIDDKIQILGEAERHGIESWHISCLLDMLNGDE